MIGGPIARARGESEDGARALLYLTTTESRTGVSDYRYSLPVDSTRTVHDMFVVLSNSTVHHVLVDDYVPF